MSERKKKTTLNVVNPPKRSAMRGPIIDDHGHDHHAELAPITPVQEMRLQGLILLEGGRVPLKISAEDLAKMSPQDQIAFNHMMEEQCVCVSKDSCRDCEVCVGGVVGHHPWDELEMLKHGWADTHGQHWCGAKAFEDEVELLHHGMVTTKGKHVAMAAKGHQTSNIVDHLGEKGRVKFGAKVQVRETKFVPEIDEEVSAGLTPSKQKVSPTMTIVRQNDRTGYLMNTANSVGILDKDTQGKHAILVIGRKPRRAKNLTETVRNVIAIEPKH